MTPETTTSSTPTSEQIRAFEGAANYFNQRLFEGKLPPVLLNFSRATRSTLGFFAPKRWQREDGQVIHELSLNPDNLRGRSFEETCSTLVHEQCHQLQQEFGKPSAGGYHNAEWGKMMRAVGLIPSKTGMPGGKSTGVHMTHYIEPNGAFAKAFAEMPAEFRLPWNCAPPPDRTKAKRKNKTKFACGCGTQCWGKPGLNVTCNECHMTMGAVDEAE